MATSKMGVLYWENTGPEEHLQEGRVGGLCRCEAISWYLSHGAEDGEGAPRAETSHLASEPKGGLEVGNWAAACRAPHKTRAVLQEFRTTEGHFPKSTSFEDGNSENIVHYNSFQRQM